MTQPDTTRPTPTVASPAEVTRLVAARGVTYQGHRYASPNLLPLLRRRVRVLVVELGGIPVHLEIAG